MQIAQIIVGPLATNSYLVWEEDRAEALLIDPGAEPETILETIATTQARVVGIVCTHGHPDHTGALRSVLSAIPVPVYIHPADSPMLRRTWPEFFVTETPVGPGTEVREVTDEEQIRFGDHSLRVLHTPGHTPGGLCLTAEEVVFSGDTLFAGGVGRTDLPGGNEAQLNESLRRLLSDLSPITLVYPGHGASTVLTQEMTTNPWLVELLK
ncbi:MAG TPA: MBL fold metallo-hydrolase [Armatimonadota bacterium]|jgi:glyoxylase-like metal-dependent hydrolase (beta-lactamase superfamily II)